MFSKPIILYNNLLKNYTVTVSSEDSAYPKGNLTDGDINSLFKPQNSSDLTIRIDAGASVAVDAFCIGPKHNLATVSATVALQYSATGAWAGEEANLFTPFDPATDNSYQHKLATQQSARYWQVKLSGMSGTPQIGEIAFGARLMLPYFSGGYDKERRVEGNINVSDGGQRETVIRHRRNAFPFTIADILINSATETEILAWLDAVEDGTPFWFINDFHGAAMAAWFVSMAELGRKSPYDTLGKRSFSGVMEEEL